MSHQAADAVADAIRALAEEEGFARVGFAAVQPLEPEGGWLERWLREGMHAGMGWMARSRSARLAPSELLPEAATVAVLAMPYAHPTEPDPGGLTGLVSSYARGRDYHRLIGKALRRMQARLRERFPSLNSYASVDSRPVYERAWASRAGVGFAGRSSCTIVPGLGTRKASNVPPRYPPLPGHWLSPIDTYDGISSVASTGVAPSCIGITAPIAGCCTVGSGR